MFLVIPLAAACCRVTTIAFSATCIRKELRQVLRPGQSGDNPHLYSLSAGAHLTSGGSRIGRYPMLLQGEYFPRTP